MELKLIMKIQFLRYLFLSFLVYSCSDKSKEDYTAISNDTPYLSILGIAQDAGFPQIGCEKACCKAVWSDPSLKEQVVALGVVDPEANQKWLFEATPDFKEQYQVLTNLSPRGQAPNGIFVTHGHMGHYTGLMHLGREAMGAKNVPVYAMPRMKRYLSMNGPWRQLVDLKNIEIQEMEHKKAISLSESIEVTPFLVPHRDEFSETTGFIIAGKRKKAVFIPDIDKWSRWEGDIKAVINDVDYAFLDGTFFKNGEIPGRDMSLIPHPFIEESMQLFKDLPTDEKSKIYFIHFNHTNPLLNTKSEAYQQVSAAGFKIAAKGMKFDL